MLNLKKPVVVDVPKKDIATVPYIMCSKAYKQFYMSISYFYNQMINELEKEIKSDPKNLNDWIVNQIRKGYHCYCDQREKFPEINLYGFMGIVALKVGYDVYRVGARIYNGYVEDARLIHAYPEIYDYEYRNTWLQR